MEGYISLGNRIWGKAVQLIRLAREEDDGPFGIEPENLRAIMDDYVGMKIIPTTVDEAVSYYESALEMFDKMLHDKSGYATVEEHALEMGCFTTYYEISTPHCNSRSTGYPGTKMKITCPDINLGIWVSKKKAECLLRPSEIRKRDLLR